MIEAEISERRPEADAVLKLHSGCFACGLESSELGLHFSPLPSGELKGEFTVAQKYQGYGGLLHGGVAGTILDSVMTHCLMLRGIKGLTAELNIKYHQPIDVGSIVSIYGKIDKKLRKIYFLSAYLETEQGICVSAYGKFIEPRR